MLASGWKYEDMGNPGKNTTDFTSNALSDNKTALKIDISKGVFTTDGKTIRDLDEFSIFIDPKTVDGQFYNYSVMLDNFVVSVVEG